MYLGWPCYEYTLNCHLVYLTSPGKRLLFMRKYNVFVLFISNKKSEIHICPIKHPTCLVIPKEIDKR